MTLESVERELYALKLTHDLWKDATETAFERARSDLAKMRDLLADALIILKEDADGLDADHHESKLVRKIEDMLAKFAPSPAGREG